MKLVQTECMTWFALIWFVGGYGWKNKNKFSLCTTLSLHFADAKLSCTSAIKIKIHRLFILYCIRFALTLHLL